MMMATLKVPPMAVPGVYIKRDHPLSSLESCSVSVPLADSNKHLIAVRQANGVGVCLDNIAFEIEDEISKMETQNGFTSSIKPTPSLRHEIDNYSDAIASTSKDEISFTMNGEKNNESISSDDNQRKVPDISVIDTTITSRRSKSVQIMDFSNKKILFQCIDKTSGFAIRPWVTWRRTTMKRHSFRWTNSATSAEEGEWYSI